MGGTVLGAPFACTWGGGAFRGIGWLPVLADEGAAGAAEGVGRGGRAEEEEAVDAPAPTTVSVSPILLVQAGMAKA